MFLARSLKNLRLTRQTFGLTALAIALVASFAVAAAPRDSDTNASRYRFNGDLFTAGKDVRVTDTDVAHLFAVGRDVTVDADVRETAHAAGRDVRINRAIGESLYAAGYNVDVEALIGEDVIAAGYRVEIGANARVTRDVLAAGRRVVVRGPIDGDASLAGDTVEIAAPIAGSAQIRAREIVFSDGARVGGTLAYWSNRRVEVPESVASANRVTANVEERESGFGPWIGIAITLALVLFGAIVLFAFGFRDSLARTRAAIAARPWRDLLLGIVATSALFGSILVLAVSLIGIPLIPLIVIFIPFAILGGYLTTAHALGSMLIRRARAPGSGWAAFGAIVLGLIMLVLVSAIPLLGWVIAVLAVILGLGAWFAVLFTAAARPESAPAP